VAPTLKLTDLGLLDVNANKIIALQDER
jgi:adenine deaminase